MGKSRPHSYGELQAARVTASAMTQVAFTARQVSAMTGIPHRTITHYCATGVIPADRWGRYWLIPAAVIDRLREPKEGRRMNPHGTHKADECPGDD